MFGWLLDQQIPVIGSCTVPPGQLAAEAVGEPPINAETDTPPQNAAISKLETLTRIFIWLALQ
jgi:hypothetical protein